jgi:hypothetical protein
MWDNLAWSSTDKPMTVLAEATPVARARVSPTAHFHLILFPP